MSDEYLKRLEGRIVELENQLKQVRARREQVANISHEEIETYLKVRNVLAQDPAAAMTLNEGGRQAAAVCVVVCQVCQICQICQICQVCIVECTCGPCAYSPGGAQAGGAARFGKLGD